MARILVIQDDHGARETLRRVLTQAGHQPMFSRSGKRAVEAVASIQPDLVITDIPMPEKMIHDVRSTAPDLPVIALSDDGPVGGMSFLRSAWLPGADRTMARPFAPAQLVGAVAELLMNTKAAA